MESRMHMNPKKIFSKLGLALFVMMFMIYAIQIGSVSILRSFFPVLFTKLAMTPWFNWALTFVSFHVIGFAIFYLMTRNIPIEEKDAPKTLKPKQLFVLFLICMATTYLFNYVSLFINYIIGILKSMVGQSSTVVNPIDMAVQNSSIIYTILVACISAPIVEELIFRKIMLDRLRSFGDKTAILVTAFTFGLIHGNLSQFFYAFALGLIFGFIAIRTNTARYTILLHIIINLFGSVIIPNLALSPNPIFSILAVVLIFGFIISGTILFFIYRKRIYLEDAIIPLNPRTRFRTIYVNVGMILYIILCLIMFVSVILA